MAELPTLSARKGVVVLEALLQFILSIAASVIAYYVCKRLDGK